jgi:hypothetical protein
VKVEGKDIRTRSSTIIFQLSQASLLKIRGLADTREKRGQQ